MSPVTHKQIYRPGPFGGTINTTLCGRLHAGNDMNVDPEDSNVTCKFCLKMIANTPAAILLRIAVSRLTEGEE